MRDRLIGSGGSVLLISVTLSFAKMPTRVDFRKFLKPEFAN